MSNIVVVHPLQVQVGVGKTAPIDVSLAQPGTVDVAVGTGGPRGRTGPPGPPGPPGEINVEEMTWAEFNALPVKDPQTIYVITDAAAVLFDRLAAVEARLTALEAQGA